MTRHRLFSDMPEILRRSRQGIREALIDHRIADNPVAVWRDNEVLVAKVEDLASSDGLQDSTSEVTPRTGIVQDVRPPI